MPPRNRSVRCLRLPMPLYAFASHSCAMVCLRTGSHALAMPSHIIASPVLAAAMQVLAAAWPLGSMLLLCCAVRAWPLSSVPCLRSVVLVRASASHGFYLPCRRRSVRHAESLCPRLALLIYAVAWCCAASQVHATPQLSAFFRRSAKSSFSISPICSQTNLPLPEFLQHPSPLITP